MVPADRLRIEVAHHLSLSLSHIFSLYPAVALFLSHKNTQITALILFISPSHFSRSHAAFYQLLSPYLFSSLSLSFSPHTSFYSALSSLSICFPLSLSLSLFVALFDLPPRVNVHLGWKVHRGRRGLLLVYAGRFFILSVFLQC